MLDKIGTVAVDRQRADQVARDGFIHLEHVIPADRVAEVLSLAKSIKDGDNFHTTEAFSVLIEELQVHRLVQSLFDQPIYYMGWSSVMREVKARPGHLHDDAKGARIPADGKVDHYFQSLLRPYDPVKHELWPVHRLFIYLNDHSEHSGGTKVRRGSHRKYEFFSRKGFKQILRGKWKNVSPPWFGYVNPMVKPGDAVLFNLRCRHAGHFVRLRGPFKRLAMPASVDNILKRLFVGSKAGRSFMSLFAYPFPEARTSLVVDFCVESDWARGFQANRLLNPGNEWARYQFFDLNDPAFVARLNAAGLSALHSPALPKLEAFLKVA